MEGTGTGKQGSGRPISDEFVSCMQEKKRDQSVRESPHYQTANPSLHPKIGNHHASTGTRNILVGKNRPRPRHSDDCALLLVRKGGQPREEGQGNLKAVQAGHLGLLMVSG